MVCELPVSLAIVGFTNNLPSFLKSLRLSIDSQETMQRSGGKWEGVLSQVSVNFEILDKENKKKRRLLRG
jgi:hypothetical protein